MPVSFRIPALALIAAAAAAAAALAAEAPGEPVVRISPHGVLVSVGERGLRNVGGPPVLLRGDAFAEWLGLRWAEHGVVRHAVAVGSLGDWAGRPPVEAVRRETSEAGTTVVTRAGSLELRTDWMPDEDGPYLLVKITLTNRGDVPLDGVVLTREWTPGSGDGWTYPGSAKPLPPAPEDVARQAWNVGEMPPGFTAVHWFAYGEEGSGGGPVAPDLPLALWRSPDWPHGLVFGATNGISWGDFDADGWPDVFTCQSADLWRNVGGVAWEHAADLDEVLPASERRYGASFGDYDADGRNDLGTEPRVPMSGDDRMHLLRNLGAAGWADVADDPSLVDVQPWGNSETLCWADVDGDRRLDAFLPVYPPWAAGPGNFFLYNEGPTGPAGATRFTEMAGAAGLDNPIGTSRPEGAQFADVDGDGAVDLFSNGTLYRNRSVPGIPSFDALPETASGIGLAHSLDEGIAFFDHDMDGDFDLFVVYTLDGVRVWENRGDGTFAAADPELVDSPFVGLNLGMSAEDWDNDGDVDFSTRSVFRRNLRIETGLLRFRVATHDVKPDHIGSAIPAWADWDKDGDLDCAMGNSGGVGRFYENVLYGPDTPDALRRHVRVRVVSDALAVPRGVETEYGAVVELEVLGRGDRFRRKKLVASSHGYLNQNEYTLHFGLGPDLGPATASDPLRFGLTVDFPGAADGSSWRVDRWVNPVLGSIDLASLDDREIDVYRCGGVRIDGELHPPLPLASPRLVLLFGGLDRTSSAAPLPAPVPAPEEFWIAGLAFDTLGATAPVRIHEIVVDGRLADAGPCGNVPANVVVWDVTDPHAPHVVPGGALLLRTPAGNHRGTWRTDVVLEPGREFRLLARVTERRSTTIAGPVTDGPIRVLGGIGTGAGATCDGAAALVAPIDPTAVAIAFRFGTVPASTDPAPLGSSLVVGADSRRHAVLTWDEIGAAGYSVARCRTTSGPCLPERHAFTTDARWTDPDDGPAPGETLWYRTVALSECAAAVESAAASVTMAAAPAAAADATNPLARRAP
jgi:hypothetical protein